MQKIEHILIAFLAFSMLLFPVLARPKPKGGVGVFRPIATEHDAFQTGGGNFYNNVSYLDIRSYPYINWYYRGAGILFDTISIPQGSEILSANLKVYCWSYTASSANCIIYGHAIGDSPNFDGSNGHVFSRVRTASSVAWIADDLGAGWQTVNVKKVVQEIVDRGDYASGNSLSLLLIPRFDAHKWIWFYSFDAHLIYPIPDYRPELVITWA